MKTFWFDCETSGLDPDVHGIIEIGFLVEIDGEIKETHQILMDPTKMPKGWRPALMTAEALNIQRRTEEEVLSYQSIARGYQELKDVLEKYVDPYDPKDKFVAAGYNVKFDMDFLQQLWIICGDSYFRSWFQFAVLDPVQIMAFLQYTGRIKYSGSMKLAELAHHFGVERQGAHDALVDIHMTRDLVKAINSSISGPALLRQPEPDSFRLYDREIDQLR